MSTMTQLQEQAEKPATRDHVKQDVSQNPPVADYSAAALLEVLDEDSEVGQHWCAEMKKALELSDTGDKDAFIQVIKGHLADPACPPLLRMSDMMLLMACYSDDRDECFGWVWS
jgi:hypothetical protein